jgi:hypothetical protein
MPNRRNLPMPRRLLPRRLGRLLRLAIPQGMLGLVLLDLVLLRLASNLARQRLASKNDYSRSSSYFEFFPFFLDL